MRIVIDTGVYVSLLFNVRTPPGIAVGLAFTNHHVLASEATVEELDDVLGREYFTERFSEDDLHRVLKLANTRARHIPITTTVVECRDKEDDKFLELAHDGGADLIISGDDDLLVMHPWRGIPILSPRDALSLLEAKEA